MRPGVAEAERLLDVLDGGEARFLWDSFWQAERLLGRKGLPRQRQRAGPLPALFDHSPGRV